MSCRAHEYMTETEIEERQKLSTIFFKLTSEPVNDIDELSPNEQLKELRERIYLLKSLLLDSENNKVILHPNERINKGLIKRGKKAMKILINRFIELDKMLSKPTNSCRRDKNRRKKQRQKERQRKRKEALEYLNSVVLSRTPSPSDEYPELGTPNSINPKFEKEWERLYRQMSRQGGKKRKTKKRKTKKRKIKKRRKSTRKR